METELGLIQKLTRLYTFYTPFRKGKNRIALASLNLQKDLPQQIVAKTKDGRILRFNFDNHFAHFVYFLGEYETAVTSVFEKIVEEGDVCVDIGANIGWFTTLFQGLVGKNGQVHSFEPVPDTFELLNQNINANRNNDVVVINNFALGNEERDITLYIPREKSDGHASISDFGKKDTSEFKSKMITLDSYLDANKVANIDILKADIEGAELSMLKGGTKLFEQEKPPILEIEMALDTTKGFNYLPNDLIEFINQQCEYEFYAIDERTFTLKQIKGFLPEEIGANVLCVPKGLYRNKLEKLNIIK